jgi:hypothetical protein
VTYIIRACCAAVLLWFAIGEAAAQTSTISSLYSSKNPSTFGDPVRFSVFVKGGTTGTVQFMDGPNNLGEPVAVQADAAFGPPQFDAGLLTSELSPGTHLMTAVYSGDALTAPGTSTLTQVVLAAAQPVSVPTLSSWRTALLALLICAVGVVMARRFE